MRTYNDISRPDNTPERISELKADEIFVFGSNLAGMHGGGDAGNGGEERKTGSRKPPLRFSLLAGIHS